MREIARVLFHLPGHHTKVVFEVTLGSGQADGGITWDIPTEKIPPHLRAIGARFWLATEPELHVEAID